MVEGCAVRADDGAGVGGKNGGWGFEEEEGLRGAGGGEFGDVVAERRLLAGVDLASRGVGGGWSIRVVAANADYFAAVCLDGRHVSGSQVSRCERLRQLTAATWLNLLHLVKIAQRGEGLVGASV